VARGLGVAILLLALSSGACSGASASRGAEPAHVVPDRDTSGLVPAGFGSLRQEDVALRIFQHGLTVRLLPLDEAIIRTLSPDSYRSLRDLRESRSEAIRTVARRHGQQLPSLWYVSFHNQESGDARFNPGAVSITNTGREFRPLDILSLTSGFGAQRLRQHETQSGILLFDESLDASQPLVVSYEGASTGEWSDRLRRIERERALIRNRAAAASGTGAPRDSLR
jgi:hypothetical protein